MAKKIPVRENIGNLEICQNTGNLVCSSCKFPDSKGKRYFNFCRKISKKKFQFIFEGGLVCQVSFVYIIVTNHINWHRDNLRLDTKNTGNLKMNFEWLPCMGILTKELLSLIAYIHAQTPT